jgi:uncharacterized membrane protein
MTKNSQLIKKLVGLATLTALVFVLQFWSASIKFGSVSITLALVPIAMGAILYGPLAGLFLGAFMGVIVIADPSTQAVFMSVNPAATIILCLLKSGLAGLAAGYLFKLFAYFGKKTKNDKTAVTLFVVGIVLSALIVPLINTTLFVIGAGIFFKSVFGDFMGVIAAVITTNFAIEVLVSALLSPALVTVIKILTNKYDLGFANDFSRFNNLDNEENLEVEEVLQN